MKVKAIYRYKRATYLTIVLRDVKELKKFLEPTSTPRLYKVKEPVHVYVEEAGE